MAVVDFGYRGELQHIKTPDLMHFCSGEEYYDASVARACHKAVDSRFKSKQVLVKHFRHSLAFHSACFHAVAVITQLNIEAGESQFLVQYVTKDERFERYDGLEVGLELGSELGLELGFELRLELGWNLD
jgi:hypothetical protein